MTYARYDSISFNFNEIIPIISETRKRYISIGLVAKLEKHFFTEKALC